MRGPVQRFCLVTVAVIMVAAMTSGCTGLQPAPRMVQLEPGEPPPPCPVTGKPVNFLVRLKEPDGPVYLCCARCIEPYEQEREAYTDLVAMQRQMLAFRQRVQVACPITGNPASKHRYSDLYGHRVYFCASCGHCPDMYEEDPERYEAALAAAYTYQTRCPIAGRDIDARQFVELQPDGPRVYFCSARCKRAYKHNPGQYAENLAAQGLQPGAAR